MEPRDEEEGSNSTVELKTEDPGDDDSEEEMTRRDEARGKRCLVIPSLNWREYYGQIMKRQGGRLRQGTLGQVIIDLSSSEEVDRIDLGEPSARGQGDTSGEGAVPPLRRVTPTLGKGKETLGGDPKGKVTPQEGGQP